MKLSEAMMLASTTATAERIGDWNVCAIGVSGNVAGIPTESEMMLFGQKICLNERPLTLEKEWPWLSSPCDCDSDEGYTHLWCISDKFENFNWDLARLASHIRSIEPSCGDCNRFECTCVKTEAVPATKAKLELITELAERGERDR